MTMAARDRAVDGRIGALRVLGALAVFLYHFMGDAEAVVVGSPVGWPPWDAFSAGSGPFGVSVFIIVSGVVYTWAWQRSATPLMFVRRRLRSLIPLYWWVALPMIAVALVVGRLGAGDLWKVPFWLTGLGILSEPTFFPVVDGWWYMSLAVQLAVVYPILRRAQDRAGVTWFLVAAGAVAAVCGWAFLGMGLHRFAMAFVGSRLLEFAVGMTIGRSITAGASLIGSPLDLVRIGAAATALLAVPHGGIPEAFAVVVVAMVLSTGQRLPYENCVATLGGLSFAFYLCHSPFAKPVLQALAVIESPEVRIICAGVIATGLALVVSWGFKASFDGVVGARATPQVERGSSGD